MRFIHRLILPSALLLTLPALFAQESAVTASPVSVVPHVIKYSGTLPNAPAAASVVEARFALYASQTGGEPLWAETQEFALDPASKYSVLLGATAPQGLPQNLFANGAPRWLGVTLTGQAESPRTLLTAAAYSLKASDAETLGGHPAADFALKNATPDTMDITTIDAGTGITVTGNGTATVTVGLNTTYLGTLGAKYALLDGENTFAGKQAITGNLALSGAFTTANGSSKIVAGNLMLVTFENGVYKIGLNGTAAQTFGNDQWAQLAGANTFTQTQTVSSSSGDALSSTSSYAGGAGVYGANVQANSSGVTGEGDFGFYGVAVGELDYNIGVFGDVVTPSSEFNTLIPLYQSSGVGNGIWADGGAGAYGVNDALTATSDNGNPAAFYGAAAYGTYLESDDPNGSTDGANIFYATSGGGTCTIDYGADLTCSGSISQSNVTAAKRNVQTYAVQSPESWIEDFGSAQLQSGDAVVTIDPGFAEVVNTGMEYHIFLTPNGDSRGLYVTAKGPKSFEVRESAGGTSNIRFDYRIVAKRNGTEKLRLADITEKMKRENATPLHRKAGAPKPAAHPAPSVVAGIRQAASR